MKRIICGYCGKAENQCLYFIYDLFNRFYNIYRCHNCRAFFLSPRPTVSKIREDYNSSYYGSQEEKFISPFIEKTIDWFRQTRAKRLSHYLKDGDSILDIGCGNGRFLYHLLKYGKYKLYGTELEGNSAKRARRIKEINLKIGSLNAKDFPSNSLKAVTLFHVFEHLSEPQKILTIIHQILKKNGILFISFPNITSIQSKIFKGKWLHLDPPRHLFFFSPDDFIKLMDKKGFKLLKKKFFSLEQNPYGFAQSFLNIFYKKREVLFESLKGNRDYIREYSKFNIFMQKLFFFTALPVLVLIDFFESLLKAGATVEFIFQKK